MRFREVYDDIEKRIENLPYETRNDVEDRLYELKKLDEIGEISDEELRRELGDLEENTDELLVKEISDEEIRQELGDLEENTDELLVKEISDEEIRQELGGLEENTDELLVKEISDEEIRRELGDIEESTDELLVKEISDEEIRQELEDNSLKNFRDSLKVVINKSRSAFESQVPNSRELNENRDTSEARKEREEFAKLGFKKLGND